MFCYLGIVLGELPTGHLSVRSGHQSLVNTWLSLALSFRSPGQFREWLLYRGSLSPLPPLPLCILGKALTKTNSFWALVGWRARKGNVISDSLFILSQNYCRGHLLFCLLITPVLVLPFVFPWRNYLTPTVSLGGGAKITGHMTQSQPMEMLNHCSHSDWFSDEHVT